MNFNNNDLVVGRLEPLRYDPKLIQITGLDFGEKTGDKTVKITILNDKIIQAEEI